MSDLEQMKFEDETAPSQSPAAVARKSIHAFVKYSYASQYGIFSAPECAGSWYLSGEQHSEGVVTMRNIPSASSIYRLTYAREPDTQSFTARLQVDADPYGLLADPPIMLKLFSACEMANIVYAHDAIGNYAAYSDPPADGGFSSEQIRRGIYAYRSDVDKWLPVAAMRRRVHHSILATDAERGRLYAIGGKCDEENNTEECRHVQAYDSRAQTWQELPPTSMYFSSRFGDALMFKGSLIVVSTDHEVFEEYDPVAGRWYRHDPVGTILNGHGPRYGFRAEDTPPREYNDYDYSWYSSADEEDDRRKYAYGRSRLVSHQNKLYWIGLGTERNPVWLYDSVYLSFVRITTLHDGNNIHPKMANCSQIYDVAVF